MRLTERVSISAPQQRADPIVDLTTW